MNISPHMLRADAAGNIYDDPDLLMVCSRAGEWLTPRPDELIPLPPESELFFLPGRRAVGLDPQSGQTLMVEDMAVAAFAAPAHTLAAHPAYVAEEGAPMLPLFAYGAVGFAQDRFWICARRVDEDQRQNFQGISRGKIEKNCSRLLKEYPRNRLVGHIINNCVRRYACPAARNFALGRHEAPLPSSRACNARCQGCISARQEDSPIRTTPQCRLEFIPSAGEIVEVMRIHEQREKARPIYSFGQGCEGDPLMNEGLLAASIAAFRNQGGSGTINCNSNASRPQAVGLIADAGLTSLRVSLNSARPDLYEAYYRPVDYDFGQVRQSIRTARRKNIFVSLNLLYFPGITDTMAELDALSELCGAEGVSMIQWRNLNIDPLWYPELLRKAGADIDGPAMGLGNFMKSLKKECPWLVYGYFNPWLGDRAKLVAPEPA